MNRLLRYSLSSVLVSIFLMPIVVAFVVALSSPQDTFGAPGELIGIPRRLTLANFVASWARVGSGYKVFFSLGLSSIITAIVSIWGLLIISSLVGMTSRTRSHVLSALIAVRILPPICLCTPIFVSGAIFGLTPATLFVISMSLLLAPVFVWLTGPTVNDFADEWIEVLRLFGLGPLGAVFLVLVPGAVGTFGLAAAAVAVIIWNEGFFSSALGVPMVVPTIPSLVSHRGTDWGGVMALGLISAFPGMLLTVLLGIRRLGGK